MGDGVIHVFKNDKINSTVRGYLTLNTALPGYHGTFLPVFLFPQVLDGFPFYTESILLPSWLP